MSYCMIIYVSWELGESLRKIVFGDNSNVLRMRKSNLSLLIALYLLNDASWRSRKRVNDPVS